MNERRWKNPHIEENNYPLKEEFIQQSSMSPQNSWKSFAVFTKIMHKS